LTATAFHGLVGADFCGLASLGQTINCHLAVGYQEFPLSAAIGDASKLEQVTERNVLAALFE